MATDRLAPLLRRPIALAAVSFLVGMAGITFGLARIAHGGLASDDVMIVGLGCVSLAWNGRILIDRWRRRALDRTLDLLPDANPPGWRGPVARDRKAGIWAYGVEQTETVLVWATNTDRGDPIIMAAVLGHGSTPAPSRCEELLNHLRPAAGWVRLPGTKRKVQAWCCYPERPVTLRYADVVPGKGDDDADLFLCGSFDIPEPIAFPRAPFAAELARHEELVRSHLDALLFDARREPYVTKPLQFVYREVAEIFVRGAEVRCTGIESRAYAASSYAKLFGIRRRLFLQPGGTDRLDVLVRTDDLVSIREVAIRAEPLPGGGVRRSLVMDGAPVLFEPTRQVHVARPPRTAVYWQAAPGGEVFETETDLPPPARSNAEAIDRLLAIREERVRREIWENRKWSQGGFVWLADSRLSAECVTAIPFPYAEMLEVLSSFPTIRRALEGDRATSDWYPVVVDRVRYAGLRWIAMRAGADEGTRPENVDEVRRGAELVAVKG